MVAPTLKTRALRDGRLAAWASANGAHMHATGRADDVVKLLIEFEAVAETRLPVPTQLAPIFGRLRLIEGQLSLDEGDADERNDDSSNDADTLAGATPNSTPDSEYGQVGEGSIEEATQAA